MCLRIYHHISAIVQKHTQPDSAWKHLVGLGVGCCGVIFRLVSIKIILYHFTIFVNIFYSEKY